MNRTIITAVLAVALFWIPVSSGASTVAEADSAYNKGEFAEAIALYNEIILADGRSSEILYNLGNAYTRAGDYGHAMLAFQRALRLDPSNKKAKDNISYLNFKVMEANKSELRGKKYSLEPESASFFSSVRNSIACNTASNTWAVWGAVCFCLFIVAVALYVFSRNVILRKIGFFSGFGLFVLSAVFVVFAFMAASYKSNRGVIISPKVKLHTEANMASKEAPVNLTRGTLLQVIDVFPAGVDNPKWYKVRLNSDFIGWIQASDFETVGL